MTRRETHRWKVKAERISKTWKHLHTSNLHTYRREFKKKVSRWYGVPFRSYAVARAFDNRRCGFDLPF